MNEPTKSLLSSKTFWVNLLAVIAILGQNYFGLNISAEAQVSILAGLNVVLRMVTKTEIVWK